MFTAQQHEQMLDLAEAAILRGLTTGGRAEVPVETDWAYPPGGYAGYGLGPPGYYYGGPWGGWGWPAGAVPVSGYPDVHVMLR